MIHSYRRLPELPSLKSFSNTPTERLMGLSKQGYKTRLRIRMTLYFKAPNIHQKEHLLAKSLVPFSNLENPGLVLSKCRARVCVFQDVFPG